MPAELVPPPNPLLDAELAKFQNDPAFATKRPTREQIARAWAFTFFKDEDEEEARKPSHSEVVEALKKLFPEFRTPKSATANAPMATATLPPKK